MRNIYINHEVYIKIKKNISHRIFFKRRIFDTISSLYYKKISNELCLDLSLSNNESIPNSCISNL